jgi:hypothetical protein
MESTNAKITISFSKARDNTIYPDPTNIDIVDNGYWMFNDNSQDFSKYDRMKGTPEFLIWKSKTMKFENERESIWYLFLRGKINERIENLEHLWRICKKEGLSEVGCVAQTILLNVIRKECINKGHRYCAELFTFVIADSAKMGTMVDINGIDVDRELIELFGADEYEKLFRTTSVKRIQKAEKRNLRTIEKRRILTKDH